MSASGLTEAILEFVSIGEPHFVLDFDGTLIPIRETRTDLALPESSARLLRRLERFPTTILSGRDLDALAQATPGYRVSRVPLNGLLSTEALIEVAALLRERLEQPLLREGLGDVRIEPKGPLTSFHLRHLPEERSLAAESGIMALLLSEIRSLGLEGQWHAYPGKKVVNLEPCGASKQAFVDRYLARHANARLVFAGDDTNDLPVLNWEHPRLMAVAVEGSHEVATARTPHRVSDQAELIQVLDDAVSRLEVSVSALQSDRFLTR